MLGERKEERVEERCLPGIDEKRSCMVRLRDKIFENLDEEG